jgi:multiple sugar transport system substrate-binding protein
MVAYGINFCLHGIDTAMSVTRRKFLTMAAVAGAAAVAMGGAAIWASQSGHSAGQATSTSAVGTTQTAASGSASAEVSLSILARSGYHQELHERGLFPYYRQKRPNIKFRYTPKGYAETYQTALLAMRNRSREYDVMYLDEPWLYTFYTNGWVSPVGKTDLSGVPDLIAQLGYYKGELYAVPITGNFNFMFYNKAVIESVGENPPKSWDDVVRIAETVQQKMAPKTYGWSGNYPGGVTSDVYLTVLMSLGGAMFDPRDRVTPVLDSNEAVEALKLIAYLANKAGHPKTTSWVNLQDYVDAILNREVAMGMVWNGWVKDVDNAQRSKVVGEVEITPAPGKQRVSQTGIWYYTIPVYSENKELAADYIKTVTTFDGQKYAHLNAGLPPTRITVFQDAEVQSRNRLARYYIDIANLARPARTSPAYMNLEDSLNSLFNKAVLGEVKPEEAVKQAHKMLVEESKKLGLI